MIDLQYAKKAFENYLNDYAQKNEKIKLKFDENNIKIPFPQMDVHVSNNNLK